jgi:DNA-binding NarL/FixJ family response regulator
MGLRVVFADDNFLVREGVSSLLTESAAIELVAVVGDAPSLLRAVAQHRPDAVLTAVLAFLDAGGAQA